jgi:hypothetical protein
MHAFSLGELASKVNHTHSEIKNGNPMVAVLKKDWIEGLSIFLI